MVIITIITITTIIITTIITDKTLNNNEILPMLNAYYLMPERH